VPTCPPGQSTTLTGTVYDPAGLHPLYDALVYVPNDPSDPGLQPFPAGVKCDQCGATAAGNPLVTTYTAPNGTFTLSGVPVGANIPLVVQLGRWRRQFKVNIATSCGANAVPSMMLTMPKNHGEGDLPRIAILGYPQSESAADLAALKAYAEAGGRIFSSDYAYAWLYQNGNFASAANWVVNQGYAGTQSASVDLVSNPKGPQFQQWLTDIGIATPTPITPVFHNTSGIVSPTQQWLYWGGTVPLHFTFNTPVGAPSTMQCGRVVFSDWHAENVDQLMTWSTGKTFPAECPAGSMTAQEAILEFMLFDLSACVLPYTPVCTPRTCAQQGITCGPAGDGCGGPLSCGTCSGGQTCGGGGAGKCGSSSCTPETCASQGIQCGQAGDGCGNAINCGNCPTGQICGLNGPGKCGSTQ